jgi:K+-sensing histidine kinase KdpD
MRQRVLKGLRKDLAKLSHAIRSGWVRRQEVIYTRFGDPKRLQQILTHLVGNAIKFTEKGKVVVRVSVARETETHVTIQFDVEDTGIGISAAAQIGLFQPLQSSRWVYHAQIRRHGPGTRDLKAIGGHYAGSHRSDERSRKGLKILVHGNARKTTDSFGVAESHIKLLGLRMRIVDDNDQLLKILRRQRDCFEAKTINLENANSLCDWR